jgi:hypothetical protein
MNLLAEIERAVVTIVFVSIRKLQTVAVDRFESRNDSRTHGA